MHPASRSGHDLDQVLRELETPLRRYLARMVNDPSTAEDLLQEVRVRIARGLDGFEGRAKLQTWAFSIATKVVADHFRRPEAKLRIVEMDEAALADPTPQEIEGPLIQDEMNACVRGVIESLPGDYRAALVLHDLEGKAAVEVAEICSCSLATAKIRIHRARLRLKEALERECSFYQDSDSVLRCDRKDQP